MSDDPFFTPSMVLPLPNKNKMKDGNFKEATKVGVSEDAKQDQKPDMKPKEKSKLSKFESNTQSKIELEEIVSVQEVQVVSNIPEILSVRNQPDPTILDSKRLILTKEKSKIKVGYYFDKKIVRYIDNISNDLRFDEDIQNHHPSTVAEELIKIGQFFYNKYGYILNTISSGDQIFEFIIREYRKEFNIINDE